MTQSRAAVWLDFSRPFTLLAPALGFVSGSVTAAGAAPAEPWTADLILYPMIGMTMAAVLNAASNGLNQIYDLEIDRVNKPKRPLPSGRLSLRDAWMFTIVTYLAALILAWFVAPGGRRECFWIVVVATIITILYSVPPFRTKRLGIWANLTIAVPRGLLLKVAGWSAVKTNVAVEPWFIGGIFGLFLLGASTTKDFADMEGDAVLTGNFVLLQVLSLTMTLYGLYVCYLMLRRPEDLAVEENHVSWAHMYRMMFVAQVGFALAYLL